jgi:predicted dehydrogenase
LADRSTPIRLAIVGLGGRGFKTLEHLLEQPDRWEFVGVADRSAIAYAALEAELYDRRIHMVWDAVDLLPLEPEMILVSTTAETHVPVAAALLGAGYDGRLLIEKPLAASVTQGRELEHLTAGLDGLAVGFHRRGSRMYAEAARILDSGELGAVRQIRWGAPKASQLSMKGAHHFDLANWLVSDRPVAVSATLVEDYAPDRRGPWFFDPPGHAEVTYAGGATFSLDTTGESPDGLVVECEQGRLIVGPDEDGLAVQGPRGARSIESDGRGESFEWYDNMLLALAVGVDGLAPCTVPEARTALEVVAAAFTSHERGGGTVALPLDPDAATKELRIA